MTRDTRPTTTTTRPSDRIINGNWQTHAGRCMNEQAIARTIEHMRKHGLTRSKVLNDVQ